MSNNMNPGLKHLTFGALLLALCGACIMPDPGPDPSATQLVAGPSAIGREIPFSFDLPANARAFPVEISASRSCGAGELEMVLDGIDPMDTSTRRMLGPNTLGATTSGTILVVPPETERDPIRACSGMTETIQVTVTVRTSGRASGSAVTPLLSVQADDGV